MYTFFVRVAIRATTDPSTETAADREEAVDAVRTWVEGNEIFDALTSDRLARGGLVRANGVDLLIAFGNRNRDNGITDRLREALALIAEVAPGSYGFAYTIDQNHSGEWNVLVLKRGRVTVEDDPWFSPMIPVVEDAAVFD